MQTMSLAKDLHLGNRNIIPYLFSLHGLLSTYFTSIIQHESSLLLSYELEPNLTIYKSKLIKSMKT